MKTSEIGGIVLNHLYFLQRNAAAPFEFLLFSVKNKTCGKDLWAIETFLHMKKSDSPIKKSHDKNEMQFLCFGLKNYASLLNCRRLQFSTPEKTLRRDKLNVMFLYKSAIEIGDVSEKNSLPRKNWQNFDILCISREQNCKSNNFTPFFCIVTIIYHSVACFWHFRLLQSFFCHMACTTSWNPKSCLQEKTSYCHDNNF